MKWYIFVVLCFISFYSFGQRTLKGTVQDKKGEPVFAANTYLKSVPEEGVTTNFDGNFSLSVTNLNDTLVVSFIGYEIKKIPLSAIDITQKITVILEETAQTLSEVIITAKDPISEQFAVTKIDKIKGIYLNPVSKGDPLKAITVLPSSTNTDETANPSLRGSSAERSRVILNGVPVYKPTRANNLNNQGFFSLFNAEIIDNLYVYASNPPLTYGSTSAGLVEIQTLRNLEANQLQVSASLASLGVFLSQNIRKDTSFIQVYGNYQFSDAFLAIQKNKLPNIKNFYTKDAGINFHTKIGKRIEFNSYNYFIDESFNGYAQSFNYKGTVSTLNRRIFTVNNFRYHSKKGVLSINSGTNNAKQNYKFANIKSAQKTNQVYTSIDYKWQLLESTNLQFGASYDYHRNRFADSIPTHYYALSPDLPSYFSETSVRNHILEAYLYTNWDINDKFTFSSGMRSNFPLKNQKYYFSSQIGLKYRLNSRNAFLLSGGKYHNYSMPSYYSKTYNLLSSHQLALDYSYEFKNILLKTAAYFKNETGGKPTNIFFKTDQVNTLGLEFYLEYNFYKYFKFSLSNSFINQKVTINNKKYNGSNHFNYFLKSTIQYNNPKLFSVALTYTTRPGIYYNEITGSVFKDNSGFYEPVFSTNLFGAQYGNYNRLDASLSKYIKFKKNALITFASVSNIFDTKNEKIALYNTDYSKKYFDFYQFRSVYFGVVWQLNY